MWWVVKVRWWFERREAGDSGEPTRKCAALYTFGVLGHRLVVGTWTEVRKAMEVGARSQREAEQKQFESGERARCFWRDPDLKNLKGGGTKAGKIKDGAESTTKKEQISRGTANHAICTFVARDSSFSVFRFRSSPPSWAVVRQSTPVIVVSPDPESNELLHSRAALRQVERIDPTQKKLDHPKARSLLQRVTLLQLQTIMNRVKQVLVPKPSSRYQPTIEAVHMGIKLV
ncbi:hypothetical protein B0H13DRAFT_1913946 [Mycena leptocephala]|nr:hypothetical protein B0H13DRAFT_1913946 [Mycena leptocephala]